MTAASKTSISRPNQRVVPKYAQIEKELREKILSQPEGQKMPPVRELMAEYAVSMATITRALRGLEQDGLISAHVGRGTFTSRSKRASAPAKLRLIGIIVPQLEDQFLGRVVKAIEQRCAEENYNVLVRHLDGHRERIHFHFKQLKEAGVAGLVYSPILGKDLEEFQTYNFEFLEHFVPSQFAGVILDQEIAGTHFPCVRADHSTGAQLLANYLYLLGHKNLAMIDSYVCPSTEMRWQAFSKFLTARGCNVTRIVRPGAGHDPTVLRSAVRKLCELRPKVTAVFAASDRIALNVLFECQRQQIDVPGQLSIAGFDDLEVSRWCVPALTSVNQPLEEIGRTAAQVLLDQIERGAAAQPESFILPVKLIERNSTEAPDKI